MPTNTPDTSWLIDQAQRFESLATSSQTFDDADMIEFFNAELQSVVTPIVQSVNEEYGVMYIDYDASEVIGAKGLQIPSQATGARLRNIQYVNPQGFFSKLPRLNPDNLGAGGGLRFGGLAGFYIRNNEIVFYPNAPTWAVGTLRVSYYRRPNTLVNVLDTGKVIGIDPVSGTLSLDNSPINNTGWSPGNGCDVIIATSPFDFRKKEITIINRTGSAVQFDPADIVDVQLGDIVARTGFSPVPQFVPLEAMQLIAQLGAVRALQSLGDTEGWKIANAKADQMKTHLINLISDRVEGQPKRLSAIGTSART